MRKILTLGALALTACGANAGVIERACLTSDRAGGNSNLCGCIQQVANITLDGRDQKLAAQFFEDPHLAQEIRQSDNAGHSVFWQKYKAFGQSAESYCR